jgi:hypothetical protein
MEVKKKRWYIEAMKKRKPLATVLGVIPLGVLIVLSWPFLSAAATYRYMDKNGTVIFTDRLESVPQEYRNQIRTLPDRGGSPGKGQPSGEIPAGGSGAAEEPSRKIEEERQRQEETAAVTRERDNQDRKEKDRQEKEKRIQELREQIASKQQEQKNLRTNWMVYDRIRLNELNQEIEGLTKEMQSLREEMGDQ